MNRWPNIEFAELRHFPRLAEHPDPPPSRQQLADGWKKCFDSLLEIRELEDDWDGQGTQAPTPEVVDSAMILSVMLRQRGILPP